MTTIDSGGTPVGRKWTRWFRRDSLTHSCFAVCAYDGSDLVGMGRVVGDFGLCFYIQDVIVVRPTRRGAWGCHHASHDEVHLGARGQDTYVGLMSAVGKEPFYHQYGFTSRPTDTLGAGMTLLWS